MRCVAVVSALAVLAFSAADLSRREAAYGRAKEGWGAAAGDPRADAARLLAYAFIWCGLALYSADGFWTQRRLLLKSVGAG